MRHEVHLLAGLGGRMCAGGIVHLEEGIDKLPSEADAKWHRWQDYKNVVSAIISRSETMGAPNSILIGGHSYGVWKGIKICRILRDHGFPVDYFAAIDPTALPLWGANPMVIPNNVLLCDEFWASRGIPATVRNNYPDGSRGGMLVYSYEISHNLFKYQSGHIALALRDEVQNRIIEQVAKLVSEPIPGIMDGVTDTEPFPSHLDVAIDTPDINYTPPRRFVNELIWHCTADPEGRDNTVENIRHYHINERGWSDIGYHGVVYRDGSFHLGRDLEIQGAHVAGKNVGTIGFSYIGGMNREYTKAKDTRTPEQKATMLKLTEMVAGDSRIKKISGHNQYASKACPSFDVRKDQLGNIDGFKNGVKT